MNTEAAELRGTAALASARHDPRTTLITLMRRELWEHSSLWIAPTVIGTLLALAAAISRHISVDMNGSHMPMVDDSVSTMVLNGSQFGFAFLTYLISAFFISYYALDCLYAERKDRSVLFWKSLPVSDGITVLSKFLVAVIVAPLMVLGVALVAHLVAFMLWQLRVASGHAPDLVSWNTLAWLRGDLLIVLLALLSSLWYAPWIAAFMLLSAWIRRGPPPWLWAILGVLVVPLFEYIFLRTTYLWSVVRYRRDGIWKLLLTRPDGHSVFSDHMRLLADLNWAAAFGSPNLWLGVVAAALLLYATARVRRYRDDT
jgi:ABC-2 type transport system permease protein